MKTPTLAAPQEKLVTPSARIRTIDTELAQIIEQSNRAHSRIAHNEQDLAGSHALARSLQLQHDLLSEAARVAAASLKECQLDATRNFGKSTEHQSIQHLMQAEKQSDAASLALAEFLAPAPLETIQKRIQELHKSIEDDKTILASGEQRVPLLQSERVQVLSALTNEGQIALLRAFNDVLSVIEEFGMSLATLRNADAASYNLLLANISLNIDDIGALLREDTSDGIAFRRTALNERRAAIQAHLQQLTA